MAQLFQRRDPIERFIEKIDFTEDCWLWTAHTNHDGYGTFSLTSSKKVFAHRFAWETFVGPLPEDTELDHVRAAGCTNRACVNPDHLDPVSHLENIRRGGNASKTECIRGHRFTPENTIIHTGGKRRCRTCHYAQKRERERAQRAKARLL